MLSSNKTKTSGKRIYYKVFLNKVLLPLSATTYPMEKYQFIMESHHSLYPSHIRVISVTCQRVELDGIMTAPILLLHNPRGGYTEKKVEPKKLPRELFWKMQLDVGMEPTFRFEDMICICKEMGIVKFENFQPSFAVLTGILYKIWIFI